MLEEGWNNPGTRGTVLSDAPLPGDECVAGGSRRRLLASPRRPGPPARSTEIDLAASCRVSTRPPPVSINAPLHA